jgi:hypothetical protein
MKKVLSVVAVVVLSMGLFSCQPESAVAETDALYQNLDISANDDDIIISDGRGGNN